MRVQNNNKTNQFNFHNMLKSGMLTILILSSMVFNSLYCWSQEYKYELKLQLETSNAFIEEDILHPLFIPSIDFGYRLNRWVSFGVQLGYTPFLKHINPYFSPYRLLVDSEEIFYDHSNLLVYGLNSRVHLLPLLTKRNLRFDLYVIPSFSIASENYAEPGDNSQRKWSKPYFSYGIGGGLKYAITRKFNIFAEHSIGSYFKKEGNWKTRIGLGFNF